VTDGKKFWFLLFTYEIWKVLVSLAFYFVLLQIFTFYDFLYLKNKFRTKKHFRLSRGVAVIAGVAVRALVEIYIDDISAALRATDLRFRLPFVSWAGLMHLILRI
jgi:hypothetical protein